MPTQTITIKLRDPRTHPSRTRTFTLPHARLLLTSAYFRTHHTTPLSRHHDGIIRLNFPDFALFAIYAEWISSRTTLTKADIARVQPSLVSGYSDGGDRSARARSQEEEARAAYEDYLGSWFLGSWMQDSKFMDAVIEGMVGKMEGSGGCAREFVRALTPSLVHVVFVASREGDKIRRAIYEAVARFATRGDVERFVPDEGGEEWPRGFVRGLMGHLHCVRRGIGGEDGGIGESSSASLVTGGGETSVVDATEEMSSTTFTTVWKSTLPNGSDTESDRMPIASNEMETDYQQVPISIYDTETDITSTATTTTETETETESRLTSSTSIPDSGSDFTQSATSTIVTQNIPPPFMGPMENMWSPASHISWPSSTSSSKVSPSTYRSQNSGSTPTSYHTASSSKSGQKHKQSRWSKTIKE